MGEQLYQYSLSSKGMEKAEEALARNHYIGPAPVPFEVYLEVLKRQSIRAMRVTPAVGRRRALAPGARRRRLRGARAGRELRPLDAAVRRLRQRQEHDHQRHRPHAAGRSADPVRDRHQRHHRQGVRPARAPGDPAGRSRSDRAAGDTTNGGRAAPRPPLGRRPPPDDHRRRRADAEGTRAAVLAAVEVLHRAAAVEGEQRHPDRRRLRPPDDLSRRSCSTAGSCRWRSASTTCRCTPATWSKCRSTCC